MHLTIRGHTSAGLIVAIGLLAAFLGGFLTHIIWTIQTLTAGAATVGQIIFAFLGLFVPPLGIVHGVGLWLGLFAW